MIIRQFIALVSLLGLSGVWAAEPKTLQRFEFTQPHMGTQFRIVLYAANEPVASQAAEAAFARIAQLDRIMSDYREDSELMRLCRQAGGEPVRVSGELFHVLTRSQELAKKTDGAFDVSVGPMVRLWRRARRQRELPSEQQLAEARQLVGHDKIGLDAQQRTVRLAKKGMLLDLGGIAKGYAAAEAQAVLKKHGIDRALVAAGGDIVVSGPPPDREGWAIGIAPLSPLSPEDPEAKPASDSPAGPVLVLRHAAVSTSGDTEQFVTLCGKRYSHIVNPQTGYGLTTRIQATVVAPEGITSDSLATAVSILGSQRGRDLLEATPGCAGLIVEATEEGTRTLETSRWPGLVQKSDRRPRD